jgi:hypothetical protein
MESHDSKTRLVSLQRSWLTRNVITVTLWPLLLLTSILTGMVTLTAIPSLFEVLYGQQMADRPVMLADGMKITTALSGNEPYSVVSDNLEAGSLGAQEIYHYEDVRSKLKYVRFLCASTSLLLIAGVLFFRPRIKRLFLSAGLWYVGIIWNKLDLGSDRFSSFFPHLTLVDISRL